jgi:hypothetical protein
MAEFGKAQLKRAQQIATNLASLHRELFDLGLTDTAGKIAIASHAIGWEIVAAMAKGGLVGSEEEKRQARHAAIEAARRASA